MRRKRTSQNSHRQAVKGINLLEKRPNTSYLLQSNAEKMPWPKKPTGREKIHPITPVKAFTFKSDKESQFLHSDRDIRMSMDKFYEDDEDPSEYQRDRIDELDELDQDNEFNDRKNETIPLNTQTFDNKTDKGRK